MSRNFMVGWSLGALTFCFLIPILFTPFDQAAGWFQGIGTFLAVAVALFLPSIHEEIKEQKRVQDLRYVLELETQSIIAQLGRIIFQINFNDIRTLNLIDFYFKNRMSELVPLGNETYFIGTDLRAKINNINIKIEDLRGRDRNTQTLKMELLNDAKETQHYVQKKQDRLAALRTHHHTAPPPA